MLGVLAALMAVLVLFGFGQALGARGHAQRAADLAAVSAAQVMRRNFGRLFEPARLPSGVPNPRHLSNEAYLRLARAAAARGARRNGAAGEHVRVEFDGASFAPTRVKVALSDHAEVRLSPDRRERVEVSARATAEITTGAGGPAMPLEASGGGYSGRSRIGRASRCGPTWRPPSTAWPQRRGARRVGLYLSITSAFRSHAEQARDYSDST
jgi:hypothetical protein